LLLYYNQVLGIGASAASFALLVALVIDAVSDPLVGSFSDTVRHRLGRRHPLMYAAAVPLALCIYLLFAPPALSPSGLLWWLVGFAVATRISFTFFSVPWNAMFAELSDDYKERSELISYRFAVAWVVGVIFSYCMYAYVFDATDLYPLGQLNPERYETFALVLALSVLTGALVSTHMTRDQIRYMRQPAASHRGFSAGAFIEEIRLALSNRDFRVLLFAVLAWAVVAGTNQALQIYMNTYFWALGGEALKWLSLSAVGGLLAFMTVLPLQARFDKKYLVVGSSVALVIITAIPVTLRFLGLAPENGSPGLVVMIVFTSLFVAYAVTVVLIMFTSMVADTVDTQELATGLRQEALFNSVITFSSKVTSGGGLLVAGLLLDFVVGLDGSQRIDRLSSTQLVRLGVIDAYVVPLCNVVWLWLALKYTITREQHAKIRAKLDAGYAESVEEGGGSYVVEAQADRAGSAATRARGTEPD